MIKIRLLQPLALSVFALSISACTSTSPSDHSATAANAAMDNVCPVVKFTPPAGLKPLPNEPLQSRAVGEPTKGGVCSGMVYLVEQPIKVYRVWSADNPKTMYGGWWSLDKPQGPRSDYRQDNNICPSWSELNKMSHCMIKTGTQITIGPGQSAYCPKADMTYPVSPTLQVYIPNYYDGGQIYVDNCSDGVSWP